MAKAYDFAVDTKDIRTLTPVTPRQPLSHRAADFQIPVSPCNDWVDVNLDGSLNVPVAIPGNINHGVDSHMRAIDCGHAGTSILIRMRYPSGVATTTSVMAIGFDGSHIRNDGNPISETLADNVVPKPETLLDTSGSATIVLTPDLANDPQDNDGNAYTLPARVDYHGNIIVIVPVVAGGGQGVIEARVI